MEAEAREPLGSEKQACVEQVMNRFPDICLRFLSSIVVPHEYKAEQVIDHILERQNSGEGKTMLAGDFPYVPMKSLVEILSKHKNHLYPTYMATLEIAANNMFHGAPLPWTPKQYPSPLDKRYEDKTIFVTLRSTQDVAEGNLIPELALARLVKRQQSLRLSMISIRRRDGLGLQQAMARAHVSECEGCFAEYPMNHLIHCDGERPHLFCPNCCAKNAETQISQSKHELRCMSIEDCGAGFSVGERAKFLTMDHIKSLDRIEKDDQDVQQQNDQQQ
ncbi:hypothetical protein LCI18_007892 [Fusarium solani-melongenae]|uniref:Uncharacterized protein n=1 Tax=Fusarium solani subsp. cucurbitae TaxID=2747967 RepID=A0ACD3Z739_FUSSC|nr:hypothetical protein LCI18_007892 [Fusarium solani-melongenae]